MADGYEVIPPEEIEAENALSQAKARIQNNDEEGGKQQLRIALNLFRNCHSPNAKAKVHEIEQLLSNLG